MKTSLGPSLSQQLAAHDRNLKRWEKSRQRGSKAQQSIVPSEQAEQEAIFAWRDVAVKGNPALAMLISTQTGMRTSIGAAVKAKRGGMPKGFPDLALFVSQAMKDGRDDWHGLFIELKRRDAVPSDIKPDQVEWGVALTRQGYCHRVCKGASSAIEVITQYLDGDL